MCKEKLLNNKTSFYLFIYFSHILTQLSFSRSVDDCHRGWGDGEGGFAAADQGDVVDDVTDGHAERHGVGVVGHEVRNHFLHRRVVAV